MVAESSSHTLTRFHLILTLTLSHFSLKLSKSLTHKLSHTHILFFMLTSFLSLSHSLLCCLHSFLSLTLSPSPPPHLSLISPSLTHTHTLMDSGGSEDHEQGESRGKSLPSHAILKLVN